MLYVLNYANLINFSQIIMAYGIYCQKLTQSKLIVVTKNPMRNCFYNPASKKW